MLSEYNVGKSLSDNICMEVLAMLRENESLEILSVGSRDARFEYYLAVVAAIQPNTTLKRFQLGGLKFRMNGHKNNDIIPVLKKNYGLEEISGIHQGTGDSISILQLNRAGRRYLVQDGSSISKSVAVLSRVSNIINSVFLHFFENPIMCGRSAVEMSSTRSMGTMDSARSTPSPGNRRSGRKRERKAPPHPGKEARMRLE